MILSHRLAFPGGITRMNFQRIKKILFEKRGLDVRSHKRLVNFSCFRKTFPIIQDRKKKFCTQTVKSPEDSFEDVEQESAPLELDTTKMFEEIAAGDPEILKSLKILEFEVALLREEERKVPDSITKQQWEELLQLKSVTQRRKYLGFLRLNELKTLSRIQKSAAAREMRERTKLERGSHYYGLSGHSLFMRIYHKDINKLLHHRLLTANLNVVLDCSYDHYMSPVNLKLCAKQIAYCVSDVRTNKSPCNLSLCNVHEEHGLGKILQFYSPGIYSNPAPEVHSKSYLDLFPKEKLLYLTPHAKAPLMKFNHDDVFIIGAYVDKGISVKASLAKAKENNLRMAKFPLDEYLSWKIGTKSLPLNIVLDILLDMAFYNDWRKALCNIPSRCTRDSD